jgi:hypothetical protein
MLWMVEISLDPGFRAGSPGESPQKAAVFYEFAISNFAPSPLELTHTNLQSKGY